MALLCTIFQGSDGQFGGNTCVGRNAGRGSTSQLHGNRVRYILPFVAISAEVAAPPAITIERDAFAHGFTLT